MTEVVDMALSELNSRFFGTGGQLHELAAMLMNINKLTTSEQLRELIESLYPDIVDADVAASQFNVVRHLQAWTDVTTLRQRALVCPASLVELRKVYCIITVPVKVLNASEHLANWLIKNKLRTTCGQQRLEKLVV